jgi:hypothetical protein
VNPSDCGAEETTAFAVGRILLKKKPFTVDVILAFGFHDTFAGPV